MKTRKTSWTTAMLATCALATALPAWADTEIEREVHKSTESEIDDGDDAIRRTEKSTVTETEDALGSRTERTREEARTATGGVVKREEHVEEEVEIDD